MSSEIASTPSLHPSRSVRGRAGGCTQRAVSEDRGDIHRVVSMIWSSTNSCLRVPMFATCSEPGTCSLMDYPPYYQIK